MSVLQRLIKREVPGVPGLIAPLIIVLDPDTKKIGFKEKGGHKIWWIPMTTAYALAIRADTKGGV